MQRSEYGPRKIGDRGRRSDFRAGERAARKVDPKREMKKRLGELLAVSEWRAVVETVRHVSGDDEERVLPEVRLLEGIDELSERVVLTGESRFVDGPKPRAIVLTEPKLRVSRPGARDELAGASRFHRTGVLRGW